MDAREPASQTLHQRILIDIERKIVSGEWPPGHRLPFEVDLAKSYDVSRMTVNKVMTQLAKSGLIERRKRSGTFVAQPKVQSAILEIGGIEAEVRSLNKAYSFAVLSTGVSRMEDIAFGKQSDISEADIPDDSAVRALVCVHYAGEAPFCVEERVINLAVVPEARDEPFDTLSPGSWLLKQTPWNAAEHRIFAINASSHLAKLLTVPKNAACLVVERRTWSDLGPVTHVRLTYPGDQHAIVARFSPEQPR